ncbi:MAG: hypothetical protein AAF434_14685 [Pseudomonadota bacterium]
MQLFSDYERDAIVEVFNIGVGRAAASLSEMVKQEVAMSLTRVELQSCDKAVTEFVGSGISAVRGVRERFDGPLAGSALLILPRNKSLELVRLLIQDESDSDFLSEMEEEALVEVGNILLNACLSSVATVVGEEIANQIPVSVSGELSDVVTNTGFAESAEMVLNLGVEFNVKGVDLSGCISLLMDIESIDIFRQKLAEYFGFDAA